MKDTAIKKQPKKQDQMNLNTWPREKATQIDSNDTLPSHSVVYDPISAHFFSCGYIPNLSEGYE